MFSESRTRKEKPMMEPGQLLSTQVPKERQVGNGHAINHSVTQASVKVHHPLHIQQYRQQRQAAFAHDHRNSFQNTATCPSVNTRKPTGPQPTSIAIETLYISRKDKHTDGKMERTIGQMTFTKEINMREERRPWMYGSDNDMPGGAG